MAEAIVVAEAVDIANALTTRRRHAEELAFGVVAVGGGARRICCACSRVCFADDATVASSKRKKKKGIHIPIPILIMIMGTKQNSPLVRVGNFFFCILTKKCYRQPSQKLAET